MAGLTVARCTARYRSRRPREATSQRQVRPVAGSSLTLSSPGDALVAMGWGMGRGSASRRENRQNLTAVGLTSMSPHAAVNTAAERAPRWHPCASCVSHSCPRLKFLMKRGLLGSRISWQCSSDFRTSTRTQRRRETRFTKGLSTG